LTTAQFATYANQSPANPAGLSLRGGMAPTCLIFSLAAINHIVWRSGIKNVNTIGLGNFSLLTDYETTI